MESTRDPAAFADTWLIIPCYNEATVIGEVIANARRTFPNIVAVDDGSADGSAEQIHACLLYTSPSPRDS